MPQLHPSFLPSLGFFAFSVCPLAFLFFVSILLTGGCCKSVVLRRYTVVRLALASGAVSWIAAVLTHWDVLKDASQFKEGSTVIPFSANFEFALLVAPFFLAVLLGAYALCTVGLKLFRFNDCEEASEELAEVRGGLQEAGAISFSRAAVSLRAPFFTAPCPSHPPTQPPRSTSIM